MNPLGPMYASTWDSFAGQTKAKELLQDSVASAKARSATMDHVLLESITPGIGKSSLAMLTALDLGRPIALSSGAMKANEARIILHSLDEGQVWIIDEIHQVLQGAKDGGWLLHVLELGQIQGPRGQLEDVPNVTIIGTTTEAGTFPRTVLQRFRIRPKLVPYSDEEATDVALELSYRLELKPALNVETARAVALAANNQPRVMQSVLTVMRDLVLAGRMQATTRGSYLTKGGLLPEIVYERTGLTHDGLPEAAVQYLLELKAAGQPMGEKPLADAIREKGNSFKAIEEMLRTKGLVVLTKTGRQLTVDGIRRAKEAA